MPDGVEGHGVDIDRDAVRYGQQHFPKLRLAVSAGEKLPYRDASFDLVMCRVALPYMHIPSALGEFSRVLSDNGELWLAFHDMQMFKEHLVEAVKSGNARSLLYTAYALGNSFLLLAHRQIQYPLNRSRIESYQSGWILSKSLRRAHFNSVRSWRMGNNAIATATRVAR
jgi:ubiquinone/menaquinone biosynthesis C-methylase UbiE